MLKEPLTTGLPQNLGPGIMNEHALKGNFVRQASDYLVDF